MWFSTSWNTSRRPRRRRERDPAGRAGRFASRRCEMTLRHRFAHLAVIAAGYGTSAVVYARLLPLYREWTAFLLPTAAATIYILFELIWRRDFVRARDAGAEATYAAILLSILLFIVALHVTVLAGTILVQDPASDAAAF